MHQYNTCSALPTGWLKCMFRVPGRNSIILQSTTACDACHAVMAPRPTCGAQLRQLEAGAHPRPTTASTLSSCCLECTQTYTKLSKAIATNACQQAVAVLQNEPWGHSSTSTYEQRDGATRQRHAGVDADSRDRAPNK